MATPFGGQLGQHRLVVIVRVEQALRRRGAVAPVDPGQVDGDLELFQRDQRGGGRNHLGERLRTELALRCAHVDTDGEAREQCVLAYARS